MQSYYNDSAKIIIHASCRSASTSAREYCIKNNFVQIDHARRKVLAKQDYVTFLLYNDPVEKIASGAFRFFLENGPQNNISYDKLIDLDTNKSVDIVFEWLITNYKNLQLHPLLDLEIDFLERLVIQQTETTYRCKTDTVKYLSNYLLSNNLPEFLHQNATHSNIKNKSLLLQDKILTNDIIKNNINIANNLLSKIKDLTTY